MPDEFESAIAEAVRDEAVKVIVLRGAGRAFCGGYDFGQGFEHWDRYINTDGKWDPGKDFMFSTATELAPTQKFMSMWRSSQAGHRAGARMVRRRRQRHRAVRRPRRSRREDARIGTPYSRMWGAYLSGMWLYRLGLTHAKEYALTGKPLSGREAADIGLINRAVPFAELESTVRKLARAAGVDPARRSFPP